MGAKMSGHSKWSSIKRQKGVTDVKRGATFTKLANAISIAARSGGDPTMNFQLRLTMDKAKDFNMPKDNIDRAIKRGTGELGGNKIEDIMYEAYGPGGTAILIMAATDNRNRASADVKAILHKLGGKLAESGAVAYQFNHRGALNVSLKDVSSDEVELAAIDAGAEDFEERYGIITIYTDPKETESVRQKLAEAGIPIDEMSLSWEAKAPINISDLKVAEQVLRMMEKLEELDDVTEVFGNFEINESIISSIK